MIDGIYNFLTTFISTILRVSIALLFTQYRNLFRNELPFNGSFFMNHFSFLPFKRWMKNIFKKTNEQNE